MTFDGFFSFIAKLHCKMKIKFLSTSTLYQSSSTIINNPGANPEARLVGSSRTGIKPEYLK